MIGCIEKIAYIKIECKINPYIEEGTAILMDKNAINVGLSFLDTKLATSAGECFFLIARSEIELEKAKIQIINQLNGVI